MSGFRSCHFDTTQSNLEYRKRGMEEMKFNYKIRSCGFRCEAWHRLQIQV